MKRESYNIFLNIIYFLLINRKIDIIHYDFKVGIIKSSVLYLIICKKDKKFEEKMSSSLDKLKALTSRLENKLEEKNKVVKVSNIHHVTDNKRETNCDNIRNENIIRVKFLYEKLKIFEKSPDFEQIFMYKAMNLSGIGLKEDDFGQVRDGKYIQIIAITYEPDKKGKKKAKNISLGYFGKAETLDVVLKNEIIEFVLRWRYEKAFQNVEHYKDLIAKVELPKMKELEKSEIAKDSLF